ncbi:pentapeptide repeat-containing protein [Streptomyces sp. NPDC102264]|uniref:pentapeptide repeat-containing protein n=1 Tax=Streptomyces sp. NPDC102264 TaxID=3366149 RepID=UPI0037FE7952
MCCQALLLVGVEAFEHGVSDVERAPAGYSWRWSLEGADLREANLQHANIEGSNFAGASLRGADLRGVRSKCESLVCTNLGQADLRGARLGGADLSQAVLTGADLRGANLRGSDIPFSEDAKVDIEMLLSARIDRTTRLPVVVERDPRVRRALGLGEDQRARR